MTEEELKPALEKIFGGKFISSGRNPTYLFQTAIRDQEKIIENPLLVAALKYCQRRWSVVPMGAHIESPQKVKKYCLLKSWRPFQTERATPGQIREWWATWPKAMVGVVCGAVSGIMSIDVDAEEGDRIFQAMLPDGLTTLCCRTPRGGKHYIFQYRPGIRSANNGNFEILSDGRIVILPPSMLSDRRKYVWI